MLYIRKKCLSLSLSFGVFVHFGFVRSGCEQTTLEHFEGFFSFSTVGSAQPLIPGSSKLPFNFKRSTSSSLSCSESFNCSAILFRKRTISSDIRTLDSSRTDFITSRSKIAKIPPPSKSDFNLSSLDFMISASLSFSNFSNVDFMISSSSSSIFTSSSGFTGHSS